jgi:hypothetical protein
MMSCSLSDVSVCVDGITNGLLLSCPPFPHIAAALGVPPRLGRYGLRVLLPVLSSTVTNPYYLIPSGVLPAPGRVIPCLLWLPTIRPNQWLQRLASPVLRL